TSRVEYGGRVADPRPEPCDRHRLVVGEAVVDRVTALAAHVQILREPRVEEDVKAQQGRVEVIGVRVAARRRQRIWQGGGAELFAVFAADPFEARCFGGVTGGWAAGGRYCR